jgi:hypothetical protein
MRGGRRYVRESFEERYQAAQTIEQIRIELLDRKRFMGAIATGSRQFHVCSHERDNACVQQQSKP